MDPGIQEGGGKSFGHVAVKFVFFFATIVQGRT